MGKIKEKFKAATKAEIAMGIVAALVLTGAIGSFGMYAYQEHQAQIVAEQQEQERIAAEKKAAEEKAEAERIAKEEAEKKAAEEAARLEEEKKLEEERKAKEEAERLAAEQAAAEAAAQQVNYATGNGGGDSGVYCSDPNNFKQLGVLNDGTHRYTWYSSNNSYHKDTAQWTAGSDGIYRDSSNRIVVASDDYPYGYVGWSDQFNSEFVVLDNGVGSSGTLDVYTSF